MLDARPRHHRNRDEPVDSAEIDERARVDDLANEPLARLAFREFRQRLLALLFALLFHQDAAAHHQIATLRIDLGHDRLPAFADERFRILDAIRRDLTVRHERAQTPDRALQPALVRLRNDRLDDRALRKTEPVADFRRRERQRNLVDAVVAVELRHDRFERHARLEFHVVGELLKRNNALLASSDVDEDGISVNRIDSRGNLRALFEQNGRRAVVAGIHDRAERVRIRIAAEKFVEFVFQIAGKTFAAVRNRNMRDGAARRGFRSLGALATLPAFATIAFAVALRVAFAVALSVAARVVSIATTSRVATRRKRRAVLARRGAKPFRDDVGRHDRRGRGGSGSGFGSGRGLGSGLRRVGGGLGLLRRLRRGRNGLILKGVEIDDFVFRVFRIIHFNTPGNANA